jgi:hypothetical protein
MALRLTGLPPVRVVACVAWFDEHPDLLRGMVASLKTAGVETLVAVDGAWSLFPCKDFRSPESQHVALWEACAAAGIRLVDDIPPRVYASEVEKRQRLFSMGESYAAHGDWLLWLDADESVRGWMDPSKPLSEYLRGTDRDVGEITFIDRPTGDGSVRYWQIPRFYRAGKFDRMGPNHFTLISKDGNALWANGQYRPMADRVVLPMLIEHHHRPAERQERSNRFYERRSTEAPERELVDMETYEPGPWIGSYEVKSTTVA